MSLKDILVRVVDCSPDDVVPSARLAKDLGVDSLSMVEVCEKLGHTFDRYISDETINSMVTVQDAVNSIVHHDGEVGPSHPVQLASPARIAARDSTLFEHLDADQLEEKKRHAWSLVTKMVIAGLAIGVVLGLGGSLLIRATGINELEPLPSQEQTFATPAPTATAEPTDAGPTDAEPTPTATTEPPGGEATLTAEPSRVAPGERIVLSGEFPELGKGALLQVQVKDPGAEWDEFPVTTRTGNDGEFRTYVFTAREGDRKFRLLNPDSGKATPAVTVTIG